MVKTRSLLTAAGAGMSIVLALSACGQRPADANVPAADKAPVSVSVGEVSTGDIAASLSYTGDLTAKYTVAVVPKVTGRIVKLNVDLGSAVKKGDVIAELEHTELDAQLNQAKANVQAAQAKLATINAQGRPEQIAQAQAAVDQASQKLAALQQGRPEAVGQAQAQVDASNAKLQQLVHGATPAQVNQAKLAVEQAKDKLFADQTSNDALVARGAITKEMREAILDADQTGIDQANAALKVVMDPPTADQVNQAQAAVDQARHALDQAQHPGSQQDLGQAQSGVQSARAALALAARPYTNEDAQLAAAGVAQAQAAADLVQTQIDEATLVAPVDGTVAKKLANEGDMASPSAPIVTITSGSWEVAVQVAEDAVTQVHQGGHVRITALAMPTKPFDGVIAAISPVIDTQTRTFTAKVEPANPNPDLRGGMSTRIEIPTEAHSGVLLLPKGAIVTRNGQTAAFTVADGRAHMVQLKIGLADDKNAEVLAGLLAGDMIVLGGQQSLEDQDPIQVQGI